MQLLIDESFAEKVIPADDSVRLLDRIVEEMDLSKLERAYDVRGRKSATEPSIMFKILIIGSNYQSERHSVKNESVNPVRGSIRSRQAKLWISTVSAPRE